MNDLYCQSLAMYQGHQSLGMYHGHADPFLYNVNLPMLSATAGMFSSVSQNAPNVHLDLLYHNFAIRCTGNRNAKWLYSFKQIYQFTLQVVLFVEVTCTVESVFRLVCVSEE